MMTIIYIGTGSYMTMFETFYDSVCRIDGEKNLVLITDCTEKIESRPECPIISQRYINHLPWPLITLLKFHYIESVLDVCGDTVLYANGNFIFNEFPKFEDNDKLNLSYMDTEKYKECSTWPSVNEYNDKMRHVLGGFFYAKKERMRDVCNDIIWNINSDLYFHRIDAIHDESALNRHFSRFPDKCDLKEVHNYGYFSTKLYTSGQPVKTHISPKIKTIEIV